MSKEHDCGERQCVINKYGGAYFTCARCLKKCYAECLEGKKEVIQLLTAIKHSNISCTPGKLQIKIKAIINNESVFNFICPQCKLEGNTYEIIARLKKDAETKLNNTIKSKDDEIKNILETYAHMEKLNKEQEERIKILENENEHRENIEMQVDMVNENEEDGTHAITKDLIKKMNAEMMGKINENMIIMSSDIEARIRVEFERVQQAIQLQIPAPEQERKRKKIANTLDFIDTPKQSTENREKDKHEKNKRLKPPKMPDNDNRDIYEIHISKFDKNTTDKDIESHIMEKSKLKSSEMFKITKLMGRVDDNEAKYSTFKVSTLRKDVYGAIINPKLWEPDFRAREFKQYVQRPTTHNRNEKRTNIARRVYEETPRRNIENENSLRKRAIFNNNRMENNNRTIETNRKSNNSPIKRTPRMNNYNNGPKYQQHYTQNTAHMQHFPQWINPNQIMFIPANQNPNFLYPINQPNMTQQRTQQSVQQTQNNQQNQQ